MRNADHDTIIELLPAYALDALDADESEIVRQHLATCASCQAELAAFERVVDAMPLAAPDAYPSPALKARLFQKIQQQGSSENIVSEPQVSLSLILTWRQRLATATEALLNGPRWQPVALLLLVVFLVSNVLLWLRVNQPEPDTGYQLITLTATDEAPGAYGLIYISRDGEHGTLIVEDLPQLDPEQQYQLWLIKDGERTSGGVFSVYRSGYYSLPVRSSLPLDAYSAFGITIEPEGGSPGPTGQRVLGFNL